MLHSLEQLLNQSIRNLRKTDILLQALEHARKPVNYYALDLDLSELKRTFAAISPDSYKYVKCAGLHGTYDDGLAWLSAPENKAKPTCIMSMGSSLGNFGPLDAAEFLHGFASVMNLKDTMLIGLDACEDPDRIYRAYNDSKNTTERFYRNGLDHANRVLGNELFKQDEWSVVGAYNTTVHRHEAYYVASQDISSNGIHFARGERLKLEDAYKYTRAQSDDLWRHAGLIRTASFGNKRDDYRTIPPPSRVLFLTDPSRSSRPFSFQSWLRGLSS